MEILLSATFFAAILSFSAQAYVTWRNIKNSVRLEKVKIRNATLQDKLKRLYDLPSQLAGASLMGQHDTTSNEGLSALYNEGEAKLQTVRKLYLSNRHLVDSPDLQSTFSQIDSIVAEIFNLKNKADRSSEEDVRFITLLLEAIKQRISAVESYSSTVSAEIKILEKCAFDGKLP